MMQLLTRIFIVTGLLFLILGVVFFLAGKLGLGRLPGDIVIRKGNVTFFFPVATMIILSIILTIIFNLIRR